MRDRDRLIERPSAQLARMRREARYQEAVIAQAAREGEQREDPEPASDESEVWIDPNGDLMLRGKAVAYIPAGLQRELALRILDSWPQPVKDDHSNKKKRRSSATTGSKLCKSSKGIFERCVFKSGSPVPFRNDATQLAPPHRPK